jgi:uncharacterized membrane protein
LAFGLICFRLSAILLRLSTGATTGRTTRVAYLDWLRGFACVAMFEVHCYDSWLGGAARKSEFFAWSQLSGTLPAPLFLFIAGISCALVTDKLRRKGVAANAIASKMIGRGAWVLLLALLFRVQEYVLGQPGAPWTDLFRVDVLNVIGISIMMMGALNRMTDNRAANAILATAAALAISLATPPLWTTHRPSWLPWYLESYINGVHFYGVPQPWLFPIFPWTAFAFAGLAAGYVLFSAWGVKNLTRTTAVFAAGGGAFFLLSQGIDRAPVHLYAVQDYWHTSPAFFLARVGIVMVIVWIGYAWCRWGLGQAGFSPLIQLGQTSLLVYWVHTEFVYGRFSILTKNAQGIATATLGLLIITVAMVLLSMARTRFKGSGAEMLTWFRREPPATVES